jgi:tetratricopeptide (TPR) repeat protein
MNDDTANERFSRALSCFQAGLAEEAGSQCRELLREQPHHPGALRLLGALAIQANDYQNTVRYLEHSFSCSEGPPEAEYNLAIAYRRLDRIEESVVLLRRVISRKPGYLPARRALAELLELQNRTGEANAAAQAGLELYPGDPALNLTAALCERRNGEFGAALERLNRTSLPVNERRLCQRILFERARLHDLLHQYPKVMRELKTANRLAAETWNRMSPGPNRVLATVQHELDVIDPAWAGRWQPVASEEASDAPVFLLGFPRSGTTLLDRILDAHPGIGVITEQQIINRIHAALVARGYRMPEDLPALDAGILRQWQIYYRRHVTELLGRDSSALLPVDKFPLHTIFIGLIHRLFPTAKIIFAQRHPLDVCLSCYMNDFELNSAMANFFTLESTARFYAVTMDLWQRSIRLFPIDYHVVKYESLLDDHEGEARRLLRFLNLEWHPGVLDFHAHVKRQEGRITPSYHQVSRPLYREAKYRWKSYAAYLVGIREVLQPYIASFGYPEN